MRVSRIGRVIVKATRFLNPDAVEIDAGGIQHDRAYALVEANDEFIGSSQHSEFIPLKFELSENAEMLTLEMPDGSTIVGPASGDGRMESVWKLF